MLAVEDSVKDPLVLPDVIINSPWPFGMGLNQKKISNKTKDILKLSPEEAKKKLNESLAKNFYTYAQLAVFLNILTHQGQKRISDMTLIMDILKFIEPHASEFTSELLDDYLFDYFDLNENALDIFKQYPKITQKLSQKRLEQYIEYCFAAVENSEELMNLLEIMLSIESMKKPLEELFKKVDGWIRTPELNKSTQEKALDNIYDYVYGYGQKSYVSLEYLNAYRFFMESPHVTKSLYENRPEEFAEILFNSKDKLNIYYIPEILEANPEWITAGHLSKLNERKILPPKVWEKYLCRKEDSQGKRPLDKWLEDPHTRDDKDEALRIFIENIIEEQFRWFNPFTWSKKTRAKNTINLYNQSLQNPLDETNPFYSVNKNPENKQAIERYITNNKNLAKYIDINAEFIESKISRVVSPIIPAEPTEINYKNLPIIELVDVAVQYTAAENIKTEIEDILISKINSAQELMDLVNHIKDDQHKKNIIKNLLISKKIVDYMINTITPENFFLFKEYLELICKQDPEYSFQLIEKISIDNIKDQNNIMFFRELDIRDIFKLNMNEMNSKIKKKILVVIYLKAFDDSGKVKEEYKEELSNVNNTGIMLQLIDKDFDLNDNNTRKIFLQLFDPSQSEFLQIEHIILLAKKENSDINRALSKFCLEKQIRDIFFTINILNDESSGAATVKAIKEAVSSLLLYENARDELSPEAIQKMFAAEQDIKEYPDLVVKLLLTCKDDKAKALYATLFQDHLKWAFENLTKEQLESLLELGFEKEIFSYYSFVKELKKDNYSINQIEIMLRAAEEFIENNDILSILRKHVTDGWLGEFERNEPKILAIFINDKLRNILLQNMRSGEIAKLLINNKTAFEKFFETQNEDDIIRQNFYEVIKKLNYKQPEIAYKIIDLEDSEIPFIELTPEKVDDLVNQKDKKIIDWVFDKSSYFPVGFNAALSKLDLNNRDIAYRVIEIKDAHTRLTKPQIVQLLELNDEKITNYLFKCELMSFEFSSEEKKKICLLNPIFAAKIISTDIISPEMFISLLLKEKKEKDDRKNFIESLLQQEEKPLRKYLKDIYNYIAAKFKTFTDSTINSKPEIVLPAAQASITIDNKLSCKSLIKTGELLENTNLLSAQAYYIAAYNHQKLNDEINSKEEAESLCKKLIEVCFKNKDYNLLIYLLQQEKQTIKQRTLRQTVVIKYYEFIDKYFWSDFCNLKVKEMFSLLCNINFNKIFGKYYNKIQKYISENIFIFAECKIDFFNEENREIFCTYINDNEKRKNIISIVLGNTSGVFEILKSDVNLLEWLISINPKAVKEIILDALKNQFSMVEFLKFLPIMVKVFTMEEIILKIANESPESKEILFKYLKLPQQDVLEKEQKSEKEVKEEMKIVKSIPQNSEQFSVSSEISEHIVPTVSSPPPPPPPSKTFAAPPPPPAPPQIKANKNQLVSQTQVKSQTTNKKPPVNAGVGSNTSGNMMDELQKRLAARKLPKKPTEAGAINSQPINTETKISSASPNNEPKIPSFVLTKLEEAYNKIKISIQQNASMPEWEKVREEIKSVFSMNVDNEESNSRLEKIQKTYFQNSNLDSETKELINDCFNKLKAAFGPSDLAGVLQKALNRMRLDLTGDTKFNNSTYDEWEEDNEKVENNPSMTVHLS